MNQRGRDSQPQPDTPNERGRERGREGKKERERVTCTCDLDDVVDEAHGRVEGRGVRLAPLRPHL
eukprot:1225467-Rhodomonas_salina.1